MVLRYILAWFGMMILAIINGAIRDFVYKPYVGDLVAHQISTAVLLLLITAYFWWLAKAWPFPSSKHAWAVGILWFCMTEVFEFGMGIFSGLSPGELLYAYNIAEGQLWILIPIWTLVGPYLLYRFVGRNKDNRQGKQLN